MSQYNYTHYKLLNCFRILLLPSEKQNCDLSKFSMISQSKNYDNFINTFGNSGEILEMS